MSRDSCVAVEIHSVPEICAADPPVEMLHSLLVHDIPGFIMRHEGVAATEVDARHAHRRNIERVEEALKILHPKKVVWPSDVNTFSGLGSNDIGLFHNDMKEGRVKPPVERTEPIVHTTLIGAGNVYLAAVGTAPEKVYASSSYGSMKRSEMDLLLPDHPHNLLLAGLVNPELTDRKIYTARLMAGDTVVAADKGTHSSWHRFDTDCKFSPERRVFVTIMRDNTQPPRFFRERRFKPGFDL